MGSKPGGWCFGSGVVQVRRHSGPAVMPAASRQCCRAHRAEVARPVRDADLHALALPVALGEGQGDAQTVLGCLEMADLDPGACGATEGAGELQQEQRPVAQPRPIGARISRRIPILTANLGLGPGAALLASLPRPAKVSVTAAVEVGEGHPPRSCR